jgi:signal transduction histidine kinase
MPVDDKVNILLVDDHPENLVALEALLEDLGQNVVKVGSGKEALKRLLHEEFAVIVLDVQMPEMDGFETAALIRSRMKTSLTPIVFLTAINKSDAHVARGYAVGAVDYIFKPVVAEVLRAKVWAFVELAKKNQALKKEISQRQRAEEEVRKLNEELERRVRERTAAFVAANEELQNEIAERKQLEASLQQRAEELAEAHRAKDQFLAMLGHELRNPLAPIRNAVVAMRLRETEDPLLQRARDVIERQVQHLSRLVDDLLDVSRITRGRIELRKEPVDLAAIAEHAVETARAAIQAGEQELTVRRPPEPLWCEGDPMRLEQVITNLLHNAAKYTEPGGQIWLTLERSDYAVLRVRDTGRGIPPEMLPQVFDLFVQANPSLDRAQGGLGLGLTLVRSLVEMHGGTVAAYSDGPGRGSEFVIRLPLLPPSEEHTAHGAQHTAEAQVPSPPAVRCAPCAVRRILVVDDNVDAAEMMAALLAQWGHQVRVVHSGTEAIETAVASGPDLVLLDIGLPEMDGYEVAKRLRELGRTRGSPLQATWLVAVTGYGQEEDRRRSQEAGLDDHLTKPVDPDRLRELISRCAPGRSAASGGETPGGSRSEPPGQTV